LRSASRSSSSLSIGRLVAAIKIHCEFPAAHRWQLEGKQRIVGHGGCGVGLIRENGSNVTATSFMLLLDAER
jgi:hypothetical protein